MDVLADDDPAIGVAVSGGSDSTALLALACDWARERGRTIIAATVDHGLRAEAVDEARAVAGLCARLGVAHETLTWRPEGKISQADARQARHGLLAQWAKRGGIRTIALGHTADDRAETLLIRMRGGSGWYGLAGPMPLSGSPVEAGLRIARPLLGAGRQELRNTLQARGVGWIEDPSNDADRFERVRARKLLARMGTAGRDRLVAIADRCAELRAAVMAGARDVLARAQAGETIRVDHGVFAALGGEGRLRLVEALVTGISPRQTPPRSDALGRLAARLAEAGDVPASTLGEAVFQVKRGWLEAGPAPPRRQAGGETRTETATAALMLDRARERLIDPRLDALMVSAGPPAADP